MNRTIKKAVVRRFHYEDRGQVQTRLADFVSADNFAKRRETRRGLTPYEFICRA